MSYLGPTPASDNPSLASDNPSIGSSSPEVAQATPQILSVAKPVSLIVAQPVTKAAAVQSAVDDPLRASAAASKSESSAAVEMRNDENAAVS